jgi:hypothetical protein
MNKAGGVVYKPYEPVIHLEVLSKTQLTLVFIVSYTILGLAVLSTTLEDLYRVHLRPLLGTFNVQHYWISHTFHYGTLEMYFTVMLQGTDRIDRIGGLGTLNISEFQYLEFAVDCSTSLWFQKNDSGWEKIVEIEDTIYLLCFGATSVCSPVSLLAPHQYRYFYENLNLKDQLLRVQIEIPSSGNLGIYARNGTNSSTMVLVKNSSCTDSSLIERFGPSCSIQSSFDMDFKIQSMNPHFQIASISLHAFFSICTLLIIPFWIHKVYYAPVKAVGRLRSASISSGWMSSTSNSGSAVSERKIISEQNWVTFLLVSIFLFQGPLYIPALLSTSEVYRIISDASFNVSIAFILMFCLFLSASVKETQRKANELNVREEQEYHEQRMLDRKTGRRSRRKNKIWDYSIFLTLSSTRFYAWKSILGTLMLVGMVGTAIMPSILMIYKCESFSKFIFSDPGYLNSWSIAYFSFIILLFIALLWWFIAIFYNTWKASKSLQNLPYLSTRFRQLSFRFFLLQIVLVLVYLMYALISQGLSIFYQGEGYDTGLNPFVSSTGMLIIISFFVYMLAYIYIPAASFSESLFVLDFKSPKSPSRTQSISVLTMSGHDLSDLDYDRMTEFSFKTANILLDFAWKSYYEDPFNVKVEVEEKDPEEKESETKEEKDTLLSEKEKRDLEEEFDLKKHKFELKKIIKNDLTDTTCMIYKRMNILIISFRGTSSFKNAQTNLWFSTSDSITSERSKSFIISGIGNGSVHAGFENAYLSVQSDCLQEIQKLATEIQDEGEVPIIYLVGHSLGGALACLCSYDLCIRFPDLITCVYTFGCPRFGNRTFAQRFDEIVRNCYRIVCERDVVPTFPKFLCLYKHCGTEVQIDTRGNYIFEPVSIEKIMRADLKTLEDHFLLSYKIGIERLCEYHPGDYGFLYHRFKEAPADSDFLRFFVDQD